jgi:predicted ribosomally synthesized peptide with SipW-like signal peptide
LGLLATLLVIINQSVELYDISYSSTERNNMRRILFILGMIAFVGAVAVGATGAFFSDTETSTGNTFAAGSLDLKVDSQSHFNGLVCRIGTENEVNPGVLGWHHPTDDSLVGPEHYPQPGDPCTGTWEESDLIPDSVAFRFFNFDDLKPGDEGENTISLHVYDNDAWGCMLVDNVQDLDVTCTEPESESSDVQCNPSGVPGAGELGAALTFDAWLDEGGVAGFQCNNPEEASAGASCEEDPEEGDNILNGVEVLFWDDETVDEASEGPFAMSDVLAAANAAHSCETQTGHTDYGLCHGLADDGRMVGSVTYYWGLAWNVPAEAGNEIQTDALTLDMIFEVEQHRNNPDFSCTPRTEPETATVTLDKIVQFTDVAVVGVDVNDFTLHLVGPGGDHILVDQVALPGLTPGAYTVSEVYSNDPAGIQFNASFSGSCTEIADTGTADMDVVSGINPTCTITNLVVSQPQ